MCASKALTLNIQVFHPKPLVNLTQIKKIQRTSNYFSGTDRITKVNPQEEIYMSNKFARVSPRSSDSMFTSTLSEEAREAVVFSAVAFSARMPAI